MRIKDGYDWVRRHTIHEHNRNWSAGILTRLARRRFLIINSVLLGMMLLSVSCDHAGQPSVGDLAALPALRPGASSDSINDNPDNHNSEVQTPATHDAGPDRRSVFSQLFSGGPDPGGENGNWRDSAGSLAFRLTLATMLGALVAFRPRRFASPSHRNPDVVQTQILLAVVACALMMIVGDSAARAFGIFAAASLVRFRTNIRDPKETTVLLITLGVGLAAGVGRWELATIFALFALFLLEILEWYERRQVVSMVEFRVRTHDVEATDEAVRDLFKRNKMFVGNKERNKESEKRAPGKLVYSLDIGSNLNTERMAEEIFSADPINIDRIELHRKKDHPDA